MRLGKVIGRITLSKGISSFQGGRWLLVIPLTRDYFQNSSSPQNRSPEPSLVVYDNLGGGTSDIIGFIEGREATIPFEQPTPIDAINAAIVDHVFHSPRS